MATSDGKKDGEDSLSPKKQKVEERAGDDEDENCPICWSPVSERSSTMLGCKHVFHLDCIGAEFNILGCMKCPICRQVDPGGNWRFHDNDLPDNALLRRTANPNDQLQQHSRSYRPSRGVADLSSEGASFLDDGAFNFFTDSRYEELIYGYQQPSSWSEASEGWRDWVEQRYRNHDSGSSALQNILDASDSRRRARTARDGSLLGVTAIPAPSRTLSLSELPPDKFAYGNDLNNIITRRRGSRMNQRRSCDVVSTQEDSPQAANLDAATGAALTGRVGAETRGASMAAEGQQRTQGRRTCAATNDRDLELQATPQARTRLMSNLEAEGQASAGARANQGASVFEGMQDPERVGHKIQAMSVAEQDIDEDFPAFWSQEADVGDSFSRQSETRLTSRHGWGRKIT